MKQEKGEEYMILKKAVVKVKEFVGKLLEKGNNLTWKEVIAIWITVAEAVALCISLFYSTTTFVTTELSILFAVDIVGEVLLLILAQLILLNENLKKKIR